MRLQKIKYVLKSIHLTGIIQAIQYSFMRDSLDRKYASKTFPIKKLNPGQLVSSTTINGGVQLEFKYAKAEFLFLSSNVIRVSWEPGQVPVPCTLEKSIWDFPELTMSKIDTGLSVSSDEIEVRIDQAGNVGFYTNDQDLLKLDYPPVHVLERWRITSRLSPEEHIYGLGERAGQLNLRPGQYTSWNTDVGGDYSHSTDPLYLGTPIYLSLSQAGSHLVYFENSYHSVFKIDHQIEAEFSGGMLRYYVIFGTLEQIYTQLGNLIGRPCMPPRWALGYHQSRWGYKSEAEIMSIIDGFEEHDLPISAIHLDIDYMDGFRLFTFNQKRYPDIKRLTHELEVKRVKTVTSINPAIKVDHNYRQYNEGISNNYFCKLPNGQPMQGVSWPGWSVFPDFTNPVVRTWWQENYKYLLEIGIAGFWHDMNEPVSFAAWGDKTFPRCTFHEFEGRITEHSEVHNLYGLLMNQAAYEALRKYAPNRRPWILTRSGWASLQRYAWNWTGDIASSWETLQQTIPTILGLGLSGHAFSGPDIGGFSGSPSSQLYLRWFQMSAFLPFFRTHSALDTKAREPWSFGEPTTSIVRKFLKLRYNLLPYLYTVAWESSQSGIPPIRPIFWEASYDKLLWSIGDEFLLGNSILIAPILRANVDKRIVVMPPGVWYSFWDDQTYKGVNNFDISADLDEIPLFIKAGTILPMDNAGQLALHLYLSEQDETSNQIYFDDGDGYGAWRTDTFSTVRMPNGIKISWDKAGEYPFPYPTLNLIIHGPKIKQIQVDGNNYRSLDNSVITPVFTTMEIYY